MCIDRTRPIRGNRRRLSLSYQPNRNTDISVITLSVWAKQVVRFVYKESGADDHTLVKVSPHLFRRLAMSLASKGNIPLEGLLRAGMWTNPTNFLYYCLRDASEAMAQSARFR